MSPTPSTAVKASPSTEAGSASGSPARFIEGTIKSARASTERTLEDMVAYTKTHPQPALLTALAAGYVLRMLPTGRLLGGVIRLAVPLAMPAALIYGVSKVVSPRVQ